MLASFLFWNYKKKPWKRQMEKEVSTNHPYLKEPTGMWGTAAVLTWTLAIWRVGETFPRRISGISSVKLRWCGQPCNLPGGVDKVRSRLVNGTSRWKDFRCKRKTQLETTDAQRGDFKCVTAHFSCTVLKVLQEANHQGATQSFVNEPQVGRTLYFMT